MHDSLRLTPFAQGEGDSGLRKITKPGNDIEILKNYKKACTYRSFFSGFVRAFKTGFKKP